MLFLLKKIYKTSIIEYRVLGTKIGLFKSLYLEGKCVMKTSNLIKIITIISLVLIILFIVNTPVFASLSGDQIKSDADVWVNKGAANNPISISKISAFLRPLANILMAIGIVVVMSLGVVIGIKYVTASPDSKGKLKTQLFGLAISGVVLAGAYGIWSAVYFILNELTASGGGGLIA